MVVMILILLSNKSVFKVTLYSKLLQGHCTKLKLYKTRVLIMHEEERMRQRKSLVE